MTSSMVFLLSRSLQQDGARFLVVNLAFRERPSCWFLVVWFRRCIRTGNAGHPMGISWDGAVGFSLSAMTRSSSILVPRLAHSPCLNWSDVADIRSVLQEWCNGRRWKVHCFFKRQLHTCWSWVACIHPCNLCWTVWSTFFSFGKCDVLLFGNWSADSGHPSNVNFLHLPSGINQPSS